MKQFLDRLIVVLLVCLLLVGCNQQNSKILYTIYPIEFLLEQIGGDYIHSEAVSEDNFILRAQVRADIDDLLEESDVLFTMGNLEPYLDVYMTRLENSDLLLRDLTAKTGVFPFARYFEVFKDGKTEPVITPYYEGAKFNMVDLYKKEPYLWMDPVIMTSMAKQIKDYLSEKMPELKDEFTNNYQLLSYELAKLDAKYRELEDSKIKLATMTPSFGIWQRKYGLEIYPIVLSKYGVLPSAEQLELIKHRLMSENVQYLVSEPYLPQDYMDLCVRLANELDLKIIELDTLTYLSEADKKAGETYLTIMDKNLNKLMTLK